jgi:hypothetical protein
MGKLRQTTAQIQELLDKVEKGEVTNVGTKVITLVAPSFNLYDAIDEERVQELEAKLKEFFTEEVVAFNNAAMAGIDLKDSIVYVKDSLDGDVRYQGYIPKDWNNVDIAMYPMSFGNFSFVPSALVFGEEEFAGYPVITTMESVDIEIVKLIYNEEDGEYLLALVAFMLMSILSGMVWTMGEETLGMPSMVEGSLMQTPHEAGMGYVVTFVTSLLTQNDITGKLYLGSKDVIRWFPVTMNTYKDISDAAICGALVQGQRYIIGDYSTIVEGEGVLAEDSDHFRKFDIAVTAKTRWELGENATAISRGGEAGDLTTPIHGEFRLKYRLNPHKRDFPWIVDAAYIDIDTENPIIGGTRYYRTPLICMVEDVPHHVWFARLDAQHILEKVLTCIFTTTETPSVGDICMDGDYGEHTISNVYVNENPSKGFIYEMEDMYGNQAPWDFYNIKFKVDTHYESGFKRFSLRGNEGDMWCPTFFCQELQPADYSTINLCHVMGEADAEYNSKPTHIVFRNNKIYGHSKNGGVLLTPRIIEERSDEGETIGYRIGIENITIHGGNIVAQLYDNSTIDKGCGNLEIYAECEDNTKEGALNVLTGVKGSEGDPVVIRKDISDCTPLAYIGKASNGDIKIWNPADINA